VSARQRHRRRLWNVVRSGICDRKIVSSHRSKSAALEVAGILIGSVDRERDRAVFFVAHASDSFYGTAAVRVWA